MDVSLSLLLFQVVNGCIWGCVIALLAVGLNLVYGLLNIVNVAQGALFMIGAFICWYVTSATGSFVLAVVLAPLIVGPIGALVERGVIRRVESEPELTIILTIGLMLVLEQLALFLFGGDVRTVGTPFSFSVPMFGLFYPGYRIVVAVTAILALLALWSFLQFSRYGLWMRAVRFSSETAAAFGVPINRVYAATFAIGTGLAALGGALAAPITNVRPDMGLDILVTVFIVVILGGLGNLGGSVAVAIIMASSEGLASVFTTPTNARVLSLAVMTCVVLLWPDGLGSALRRPARR